MSAVATRGRRYPAAVMNLARRLAEQGARPAEITRALNGRGVPVHIDTVCRWIDQDQHDRRREASVALGRRARAMAGEGRLRAPRMSPEAKLQRILSLDEMGLDPADIALVMNFDLGCDLTPRQVQRAVRTGEIPKQFLRRTA